VYGAVPGAGAGLPGDALLRRLAISAAAVGVLLSDHSGKEAGDELQTFHPRLFEAGPPLPKPGRGQLVKGGPVRGPAFSQRRKRNRTLPT